MTRCWFLRLAVLGGVIVPLQLAAQRPLPLEELSTRDLYRLGRARAEQINQPCAGDLRVYLEGVAYLYAYHQAATRDGSYARDPQFAALFAAQFNEVVNRAQRCLKAYAQDASSSGRDDPKALTPSGGRPAPAPGVPLPEEAPPGAPAPAQAATDAQVRTIPELVAVIDQFPGERAMYRAEIDRLTAERDAYRAEVIRLRNAAAAAPSPPPPPAPSPAPAPIPARLNTEYRVRVKASGLYWYINAENHLSTRAEPGDDANRFIIEGSGEGGYRIRHKATGRYLYVRYNYLIGTVPVANDGDSVFFLDLQPDGSYRIQAKARSRYLLEDRTTQGWVTALAQPNDDYTRFYFVP